MKQQNCKKCTGKGYRTELKGRRDLGNIGIGNTYSEKSGKQIDSFISIAYCDCNRGKELETAVKHLLEEQKKEIEQIILGEQKKILGKYDFPPVGNKEAHDWFNLTSLVVFKSIEEINKLNK